MKVFSGVLHTNAHRIMFGILLFLAVSFFPNTAAAEDNTSLMQDVLRDQMESREIRELQKNLENIMSDEARNLFPWYSARQLMQELVSGNITGNMDTLPQKFINLFIA